MNQYDVIVIGSDINGLVTSAMIAKSGKKVLVIDERGQIGGLTAMQKFSSGSMVNPVYDAIIDELEKMPGSLDNTRYTDLVNQAVNIYISDISEIMLLDELHVVVYDTKLWKGCSGC